jgi:hypothetical protein
MTWPPEEGEEPNSSCHRLYVPPWARGSLRPKKAPGVTFLTSGRSLTPPEWISLPDRARSRSFRPRLAVMGAFTGVCAAIGLRRWRSRRGGVRALRRAHPAGRSVGSRPRGRIADAVRRTGAPEVQQINGGP